MVSPPLSSRFLFRIWGFTMKKKWPQIQREIERAPPKGRQVPAAIWRRYTVAAGEPVAVFGGSLSNLLEKTLLKGGKIIKKRRGSWVPAFNRRVLQKIGNPSRKDLFHGTAGLLRKKQEMAVPRSSLFFRRFPMISLPMATNKRENAKGHGKEITIFSSGIPWSTIEKKRRPIEWWIRNSC